MKILHVCETYLPILGGAEYHISEITKKTKEADNSILIITGTKIQSKEKTEYNVLRWKTYELGIKSLLTFPLLILRLIPFISKYDLIHAHYSSNFAAASAIVCKFLRKPLVITLHGRGTLETSVADSKIARLWRYTSLNFASLLVAPSNEIAKFTQSLVPKAKIIEIPNGVDTAKFRLRRNHQKSQEIVRFVILRRLTPKNGVKYALEVIQEIANRNRGLTIHLDIIGDGSQMEVLKALVSSKNNQNLHVELHGKKPRNDAIDIIQLADFSIFFSTAEAISLALLETMSIGIVPICTRVGGFQEIIRHGQNGYLSSAPIINTGSSYNAPRELSDEIFYQLVNLVENAIFQPSEKYFFMSRNASDTAKDYDWTHIYSMLEKEYMQQLKKFSS